MMQSFQYFCSPIYKDEAPEYLTSVREVAEEYIEENRKLDRPEAYPVVMSNTFQADPRVFQFGSMVAQAAWDALDSQGYDMSSFTTHIGEMWMQEHHKFSSMEQHIHRGYQMVGFYFLDTPLHGSRAVFHDPRPGKVILDLPQKDVNKITHGSDMVNFEVHPGDLILTNAWLPHSFTRNGSEDPVRFVHINIFVQQRQCEVV